MQSSLADGILSTRVLPSQSICRRSASARLPIHRSQQSLLQLMPSTSDKHSFSSVRRHLQTTAAAVVADRPPTSERIMTTVDVPLGDRSYPIYIGQGLLDQGELLQRHVPGKRVLIVTNTTIAPLYLDRYWLPPVESSGAMERSHVRKHRCKSYEKVVSNVPVTGVNVPVTGVGQPCSAATAVSKLNM